MRRFVVAATLVLGFCAAGIATPTAGNASTRHVLIPGRWTNVGPASRATKVWTFTVPRTGFVLVRLTNLGASLPPAARAPLALARSDGRTLIQKLRSAALAGSSTRTPGAVAEVRHRLARGTYTVVGHPAAGESVRVDLVPDGVEVLDGALGTSGQRAEFVVGELINGSTSTRRGITLTATFRDARGKIIGHGAAKPVFDRIPPGGTDPVAAAIKAPPGTATASLVVANQGRASLLAPPGIRATVTVITDEACVWNSAGTGTDCFDLDHAGISVTNVGHATRKGIRTALVELDALGDVRDVEVGTAGQLRAGKGAAVDGSLDVGRVQERAGLITGTLAAYAQASS